MKFLIVLVTLLAACSIKPDEPRFRVGEKICAHIPSEFKPKTLALIVEGVGKKNYYLGSSGDINNSKAYHYEETIETVDKDFHLCGDLEWEKNK